MHHERAVPIAQLPDKIWREKIEDVRQKSCDDLAKYHQAKIAILQAAKNQIEEVVLQSRVNSLGMSHEERYMREQRLVEAYDQAYITARSLRRIVWHNIEIRLAEAFKSELAQMGKQDLEQRSLPSSMEAHNPLAIDDFIQALKDAPPEELPDFLWSRRPIGRPAKSDPYIEETPAQAEQRRKKRFAMWDEMADDLRGGKQARWRLARVRTEPHPLMDPDSAPFSAPQAFTQVDRLSEIWAETAHLRIKQPEWNPTDPKKSKPIMPHIHSIIEELMGDREQEVAHGQKSPQTDGALAIVIPNENEPLTWNAATHATRGFNHQL